MIDANRLLNADLSKFDDDALLAALGLLEMGIDSTNEELQPDKIEYYAAYGRISLELDKRGH